MGSVGISANVPRLAASAQLPAPVEPVSKAMQDGDLVPECPLGLHRHNIGNSEFQGRNIISDIRANGLGIVRVQRRRVP